MSDSLTIDTYDHDALEHDVRLKLERLLGLLEQMRPVMVAYSGGVDSTFLAAAAHRALGAGAVAVTAVSASYPDGELAKARGLAEQIGIRMETVQTDEMANPEYVMNAPDRCYHCKTALADAMEALLKRSDSSFTLVYGAVSDDVGDYRPGMSAAEERGIRAPLVEVGLSKADVRAISRAWGLPTWNQPASACLSSRIPYGTPVTEEALRMVDRAESFLKAKGFREVRVRHHESLARVEVAPSEMGRFFENGMHDEVTRQLRDIGYQYVTLDLQGYRSGSLNEGLNLGQNGGSTTSLLSIEEEA